MVQPPIAEKPSQEQPESGTTGDHKDDDEDQEQQDGDQQKKDEYPEVAVEQEEDNELDGVEDELQGLGGELPVGDSDTF